jgi:hypothetical protein
MDSRLQKVIDEERLLTLRGVPQIYWAYLAYNTNGDGLGTWTPDRWWIVKDIVTPPNEGLTYAVVDGRDKGALTQHIHISWQGHGSFKRVNGVMVPLTEEDWETEWKEWLSSKEATQ